MRGHHVLASGIASADTHRQADMHDVQLGVYVKPSVHSTEGDPQDIGASEQAIDKTSSSQ